MHTNYVWGTISIVDNVSSVTLNHWILEFVFTFIKSHTRYGELFGIKPLWVHMLKKRILSDPANNYSVALKCYVTKILKAVIIKYVFNYINFPSNQWIGLYLKWTALIYDTTMGCRFGSVWRKEYRYSRCQSGLCPWLACKSFMKTSCSRTHNSSFLDQYTWIVRLQHVLMKIFLSHS